jgi:photoactive yellow protein
MIDTAIEPGLSESPIHDLDTVERIGRLTREEVDALPYGLMTFDERGVVHLYNRYESELSRRQPEDVVGKSWFRDVAPCTRVAAFEGRFRAFVARGDRTEVMRFAFRFHFLHGAQDVEVTFAHAPEVDRVFVIVARRALGDSGQPLDVTHPVSTRLEDGRARGGLGAALPAPRRFWAKLFDTIEEDKLTSAAGAWGDALLEGAESYAERVHGKALAEMPTLLAVALVDEAVAAQGLGRVEIDFGGQERGVLGFAVRGIDLPVGLDELLYRGVLRAIARGLTGRELEVELFARHGEVHRFAATTAAKVKAIRDMRGASAGAIARATGLEVWE